MDTKGGKDKTTQNTKRTEIIGSIDKVHTEKLKKQNVGNNG